MFYHSSVEELTLRNVDEPDVQSCFVIPEEKKRRAIHCWGEYRGSFLLGTLGRVPRPTSSAENANAGESSVIQERSLCAA